MLFDYKNIKSLNDTETDIYQYVVNNMEDVLKMNVRDLADATFVSTATIVRFCRKLNCEGFPEFKEKLREYHAGSAIPDFQNEYAKLEDMLQMFSTPEYREKIHKFGEYIQNADELIFFGIGNSGAIAKYAARYFSNIGYFAAGIDDPFYPPVLKKDHKIVAVMQSESGETVEMLDQLHAYKSQGVTILAITNAADSTLAKEADYCLFYAITNVYLPQTYNLTSQVPAVFLIEACARELQRKENRMASIKPSTIHPR